MLVKLSNIEEVAIRVMSDEARGAISSNLVTRATWDLGYDESNYCDNTAVIGILYKDARTFKVLHMDGKSVTTKVGNAYVLDISKTDLLLQEDKFRDNVQSVKAGNLPKYDKERLLNKLASEHIRYCVSLLKHFGIYANIPNKNDILALDIIILR